MLKEDFCPMCITVPLALAGMGVSGVALSGNDYNRRKIIVIVTVSVFVIILVALFIYGRRCSSCST